MADGDGDRRGMLDTLPTERLTDELHDLLSALAERAVQSASGAVRGLTDRLTDYAENDGGPGLAAAITGGKALAGGSSPLGAGLKSAVTGVKEKVKGALGGGGGGGTKLKVTVISEDIDLGVPLRVAYDQWTLFQDFPSFMKKVESVNQESEEKVSWKAQVFWSHRNWDATIIEQVPDDRIVWRSSGEKGHVDGTVTFHELGPTLTRILMVLEYYPQGLFERTGNIWRAQGRRARLELKHFRRHVMTRTILEQDELEGWRGEIRDSQVTSTGEDEDSRPDAEESEYEDEYDEDDEYSDDEYDEDDDYTEDEYDEDDDEADAGRRVASGRR